MSPAHSVAVIGAGMAGAAAARRLSAAKMDVLVVDKGRGVGGRMATRRLGGDLRFDHGAQYFTARDTRFLDQAEAWVAAGVAARWAAGPGWFVGTPAMTAPARALTDGLSVLTGCTVGSLRREAGAWQLADASGHPVAGGRAFDTLLVTAPAPQAAALLATAGIHLPELARVRYAPCWALMLAHDGPSAMAEPARRDLDPVAALAWVAQDQSKPGRSTGPRRLVAHASPTWSRAHLERGPDEVAGLLQGELERLLGRIEPERMRSASAHRWRYALVEEAMGEPCLWRPDLRLGFAGDGCLGGRVEAAFLSGLALAEWAVADG